MNKIHVIEPQGLTGNILKLIIDGRTHKIDLAKESEKLAKSTQAQMEDFIVAPSGYGIHWPQLDEDLAIDPMIGAQHETPIWKVAEEAPQYKTKRDEI